MRQPCDEHVEESGLGRVGPGHSILPELFGLGMIFEHLATLVGILQFDTPGPFPGPIEEELGRALADAPLRLADLNMERRRRSEAERLAVVRDRPDQEPATRLKAHVAQRSGLR